jgi:hypothetical protein
MTKKGQAGGAVENPPEISKCFYKKELREKGGNGLANRLEWPVWCGALEREGVTSRREL